MEIQCEPDAFRLPKFIPQFCQRKVMDVDGIKGMGIENTPEKFPPESKIDPRFLGAHAGVCHQVRDVGLVDHIGQSGRKLE